MEGKMIDFTRTVYQICSEDPAALGILAGAGFREIAGPGVLATAGRLMTIPKGAAMKGIDLDRVKRAFIAHGYRIKEGTS
jgi:hypothetical protein